MTTCAMSLIPPGKRLDWLRGLAAAFGSCIRDVDPSRLTQRLAGVVDDTRQSLKPGQRLRPPLAPAAIRWRSGPELASTQEFT